MTRLEERFWEWFDGFATVEDAEGDRRSFDGFMAELQSRAIRDGVLDAYGWALRTYLLEPVAAVARREWITVLVLAWVWAVTFLALDGAVRAREGALVVDTYTTGEAMLIASSTVVLAAVAGRTGQYIYEQARNGQT